MIKSKKAMLDDLFDFLFLVIVMMEGNGKVDDYLIQNRLLLEQGKEIKAQEFNSELNYLYKSGGLSSPPPELLKRYGE